MRRIRFSIYSDIGKQRDEYRMQRFNESLQKARKANDPVKLHRKADYYKSCLKSINGAQSEF
jgi:hypothetical protein